MKAQVDEGVPFAENLSALYAAARNSLYQHGKKIEILGNFHPKLHYIGDGGSSSMVRAKARSTRGSSTQP